MKFVQNWIVTLHKTVEEKKAAGEWEQATHIYFASKIM